MTKFLRNAFVAVLFASSAQIVLSAPITPLPRPQPGTGKITVTVASTAPITPLPRPQKPQISSCFV
jgi:hypothetical protein